MDVFENLLTPSQTARALGVTTERVRQLRRECRLDAVLTPFGANLISRASVERYIEERERNRKPTRA